MTGVQTCALPIFLTSSNLISNGQVYSKLLESIILTKTEAGLPVKADDLLIGDVDAILIATRTLAYGKNYQATFICQSCQAPNTIPCDLSMLEARDFDLDTVNSDGTFDYKFNDDITLTLKLMTRRDDREIRDQLNSLEKHGMARTEVTTRLKKIIVSVNGDKTDKTKNDFVSNMRIQDSRKFREEYAKIAPGLNFDISYVCQSCQSDNGGRIVIGPNFFWPDS